MKKKLPQLKLILLTETDKDLVQLAHNSIGAEADVIEKGSRRIVLLKEDELRIQQKRLEEKLKENIERLCSDYVVAGRVAEKKEAAERAILAQRMTEIFYNLIDGIYIPDARGPRLWVEEISAAKNKHSIWRIPPSEDSYFPNAGFFLSAQLMDYSETIASSFPENDTFARDVEKFRNYLNLYALSSDHLAWLEVKNTYNSQASANVEQYDIEALPILSPHIELHRKTKTRKLRDLVSEIVNTFNELIDDSKVDRKTLSDFLTQRITRYIVNLPVIALPDIAKGALDDINDITRTLVANVREEFRANNRHPIHEQARELLSVVNGYVIGNLEITPLELSENINFYTNMIRDSLPKNEVGDTLARLQTLSLAADGYNLLKSHQHAISVGGKSPLAKLCNNPKLYEPPEPKRKRKDKGGDNRSPRGPA